MRTSLFLIALITLAGCGDWTYGRDLEGEVVTKGTRLQADSSGAEEKIALVIDASVTDDVMDGVAGGPSGVAIECLSTRCATLEKGSCHSFRCKHEYRSWEPDIIECKHKKETVCPPSDTPAAPSSHPVDLLSSNHAPGLK